MARDRAKPRNGPWLKRVLIPFWVVQLILMIFVITVYVLVMVDLNGFTVTFVLLTALSALCIILDVTEIILFARRKLKPLTYLIFQLVKTPIWFGLFVDVLVRGIIIQHQEGLAGNNVSVLETVDAIIFGVLFFVFLGSLIYGSVLYHRHRRNKRKGLKANNITQNPYYNGPYSENGVTTANYQPLKSPYPSQSEADNTLYRDESVMTSMPAAEHYTPDQLDKKRRVSSVGSVPSELAGQENNSFVGRNTKELPAVPEVYELASAKSIRRSNNIGARAMS